MNRFLVIFAVVSCLLLPCLQAAPLKVVSWNLEWFPGKRPTASAAEADAHMNAAREALKKINPDVFIGLEVRDWASFNELISALPGLTTHVVSNFTDPLTGEIRPQQIGIASRLTCRAGSWETWKANVPNISRGFSYTALEQKDGSLLMVYGNHLKSNHGDASEVATIRNEQAKQLIGQREIVEKAFKDRKIAGWILAGDFNTNQDGQFPQCHVIEELTAAGFHNTWASTPREKRLTWQADPNGRFESTTFDYFFTLGLGELNAILLDSAENVSDHHPIELILPEP